MALVSSNSLVVPLQTEFFALEGLTQLIKTIERIKVNLNPKLNIRGILLTMYDKRNKLSSQVEKEARDYFSDKVYTTVIPRSRCNFFISFRTDDRNFASKFERGSSIKHNLCPATIARARATR